MGLDNEVVLAILANASSAITHLPALAHLPVRSADELEESIRLLGKLLN